MAAAGLTGLAVTTSWLVLVCALAVLGAAVLADTLQRRQAKKALGRVGRQAWRAAAHAATLERTQALLAVLIHDLEQAADGPGGTRLPAELVPGVARELLGRGDVLGAYDLLSGVDSLAVLDTGDMRLLRNGLIQRGYLAKALDVAGLCGDRPSDDRARGTLAGKLAVYSGGFVPTVRGERSGFQPCPGRILHLVGKSLPESQAGYTLRTHYIATAQRQAGLDPQVATQMGFGHQGDDFARDEVDSITYHRIPGPAAGSERLDLWLDQHVQRVAELVRMVRPAVLHAASDHLNAQTAQAVGEAFGIPVVYESRGFWEETWLSRQARTFGWDLQRLADTHGLPDVYRLRRELEDHCRRGADRVVTLADVMAERIHAGGVPKERITVVPNAVDVDAFPVLIRNRELAARLGIGADTTVIGYISSVVEYEGIDTLVSAYAAVKAASPTPVALLIVGEGQEREGLMAQAASLGLEDAIFTGQVPHETVLDYYSLIDIFVVPRRPVEVCHLVTPLKPFEAFSTGRTVVLSNVRALAAIAQQSRAAELFEAGDELSLASVLLGLLKDPERRTELAAVGAAWVRAERTWAANAQVYLRLYEELGVVAPAPAAAG
jgi:glycosyltransferase involved in cell wall biosynthesis